MSAPCTAAADDMDYTLVHYDVEQWEVRSAAGAVVCMPAAGCHCMLQRAQGVPHPRAQRLPRLRQPAGRRAWRAAAQGKAYAYGLQTLREMGVPVEGLRFDRSLVIRGLIMDTGAQRPAWHGCARCPAGCMSQPCPCDKDKVCQQRAPAAPAALGKSVDCQHRTCMQSLDASVLGASGCPHPRAAGCPLQSWATLSRPTASGGRRAPYSVGHSALHLLNLAPACGFGHLPAG